MDRLRFTEVVPHNAGASGKKHEDAGCTVRVDACFILVRDWNSWVPLAAMRDHLVTKMFQSLSSGIEIESLPHRAGLCEMLARATCGDFLEHVWISQQSERNTRMAVFVTWMLWREGALNSHKEPLQ